MMIEDPLLTVEDHFMIEGRGLVVVPLLDVPPRERRFSSFSEVVRIIRPDGTEDHLEARFMLEHFSMLDRTSRWNISPLFPDGTKESVPIGTRVFVSAEGALRLKGQEPNKMGAG